MTALPAWLPVGAVATGMMTCGVCAGPGPGIAGCTSGAASCCVAALPPGALPGAAGPACCGRACGGARRRAGCAGRRRLTGRRPWACLAGGMTTCGTPGIAASADVCAWPERPPEAGAVSGPASAAGCAPAGDPGEACPPGRPFPLPAVVRLGPGAGSGQSPGCCACAGDELAPLPWLGAALAGRPRSVGRAGCARGAGREERPG